MRLFRLFSCLILKLYGVPEPLAISITSSTEVPEPSAISITSSG